MATYPTGWLRLPTDAKDFKERFAWSHVKAIFYDKAKNILLKDKLDAMDKLISDHADAIANKLMTNDAFNTAIADYVTKSMMSGVQVNDGDHVPTSALAYAMQQAITANANAITKLNSDLKNTISSNGTVINPNIAKSVLTVFDGWDSNAANYNSFFKNKMSILITVWVWNNTIGNLEAERAQCMIHSSKIMYRYYDYNHNWSEWG